MRTKKLAKLFDREREDSPSGVQCTFIPLDKKWACKFYPREGTRDFAFKNQKKAHGVGLGPEVGGVVHIPGIDSPYGYITEIITPVDLENDCAWGWTDRNEDELMPIIDELEEKTGWRFVDYHGLNWGRNKEGVLMPIDFG